jgi:hypothetical protein
LSNDALSDRSPFFGVVSLGINLGMLFQGSGNSRAASGRKRLVASGRDSRAVRKRRQRWKPTSNARSTRSIAWAATTVGAIV